MSPPTARLARWIDEVLDAENKDAPYIVTEQETLTRKQAAQRIRSTNTLFQQMDLKGGDILLLATQDDMSLAVLFLSALRNGIVAAVADPSLTPSEFRNMVDWVQPAAIFTDAAQAAKVNVSGLVGSDRLVCIGERQTEVASGLRKLLGRRPSATAPSYPDLLKRLEPTAAFGNPQETDTALILFTSGTTSRPKGVELTQCNLYAQTRSFIDQYQLAVGLRLLNVLPLHHTDGLTQGVLLAFLSNCNLYRPFRFRMHLLPALLDTIYSKYITHFITVPSVLAMALRLADEFDDTFDTDQFRFIISTAAHLDAGLWNDFEERFQVRVVNVYGLTETVSEALYCGPDDDTRKLGTIGKPVGCEALIVNDDDQPLDDEVSGELIVRGDIVMKGYFRDPEATSEVLREGWLYTGDLAQRDRDGYYRIVGRKKNVVIRGGINVCPEEVTGILHQLPDVTDAVCFGLPANAYDERLIACIVPNAPVVGDEAAKMADTIMEYCRERLAPEKRPDRVFLLEAFPRGPSGKVVLEEVKNIARDRISAVNKSTNEGSVREKLYAIAASCFGVSSDRLSPASNFENTEGWDSLSQVNLVVALEREFGVQFQARDIMNLSSMADVEHIMTRKLAG